MSQPQDLQPKEVPSRDPSEPHVRRYGRYYDRPYGGWGVLWPTLLLLLIWLVVSMFFPQVVY
jgi:hypothetical protein